MNIRRLIFPAAVLENSFDFLRSVGQKGFEAVALFAGRSTGETCNVTDLYIPRQETYKTESGLMYLVPSEELSALDDWLFEKKISLICQMHTHPGRAYHSTADDVNCIVTVRGGVSIVIPDFATGDNRPEEWAVYRLYSTGWTKLSKKEKEQFIKID